MRFNPIRFSQPVEMYQSLADCSGHPSDVYSHSTQLRIQSNHILSPHHNNIVQISYNYSYIRLSFIIAFRRNHNKSPHPTRLYIVEAINIPWNRLFDASVVGLAVFVDAIGPRSTHRWDELGGGCDDALQDSQTRIRQTKSLCDKISRIALLKYCGRPCVCNIHIIIIDMPSS